MAIDTKDRHLREVYLKFFSKHGGQFKCIFSIWKLFNNFKCICEVYLWGLFVRCRWWPELSQISPLRGRDKGNPPTILEKEDTLQLGKRGAALGGGLPPSEPPASFFVWKFDVLCWKRLYSRALPGSSRCGHWIGLVVAIRNHRTRAL